MNRFQVFVIGAFLIVGVTHFGCNGGESPPPQPPRPLTYEMLDSVVVGWRHHFTPDTIEACDTLVIFWYKRYMPKTVAFWFNVGPDSQIVEIDTIPYYPIHLQEVKRIRR